MNIEHLHEKVKDHTIIDMDFHLQVPVEKLNNYIDNKDLKHILETKGSVPAGRMGWQGTYAANTEETPVNEAHGRAIDRESISAVMEQLGIDIAIVTPGTNLPFSRGRYPVLKTALVKAYNDYLIDKVIDVDNGIYATAMFADWDPQMAVKELDRVGSMNGFVGAQSHISKGYPFGNIEHDPIFDKLVSLEFPLVLHPNGLTHRYSLIGDSLRTFTEAIFVGSSNNTFSNIMHMIMTGVFDKYPDLNVVIQEAGTAWIPFVATRADELYQCYSEDVRLVERMRQQNKEYLEKLPSDYIRDNFYVTTQPVSLPKKRNQIDAMLEVCDAEDMFMFSTDFPHVTLDVPNWIFEYVKDEDVQERILNGNARSVLRLP